MERGEEREEDVEIKQIRKMFLKELKISGRIGDLDHKDTLSYTSLCYQMRSAKTKGYSDKEIMSAVIKSINPSLELRAYLEGRTNLTYQSLITTLRSHYKELDATSLFTMLSTGRQLGHETAQEFTMRLMSLKQKILFVSQENPCGYSPELVQERFMHAMLTGLKSDNIRTELRPILKNRKTTDDELIENLTKAVADEIEHQHKFNKPVGRKSISVNSVEPTHEKEKKENPIMKEISELKAQVQELTAFCHNTNFRQSQPIRHDGDKYQQQSRRNRCDKCVKDGIHSCDHCFICFSSEHLSRGCKQKRKKSYQGSKNGQ